MSAASVSFRSVSMRYEEGPLVLEALSAEIPAGRFHALLGPSGCGKSTMLRLAAGLLAAEGGAVDVGGTDPCREGGPSTGFVFQEPALLPWLDVAGNIELPLRLAGVGKAERRTRALELAARMGLSPFTGYYPRQLSGGMKMRVSVARALAESPSLMLFDEPFTGLDAVRRDRFGTDLLEIWRREGWTALFVTHNVSEAVYLAETVHLIGGRPGRIAASIPVPFPHPRPPSVRADPAFGALVADITSELARLAP